MAAAQKLIFIFTLLWATQSTAGWSVAFHHAGFFGELAIGALYEPSVHHTFDLSLGYYADEADRSDQLNLAYRYTHWIVPEGAFTWHPIQAGIFAITAHEEKNYFYRSPSKYPESDYYDQTALRLGLELGTLLNFQDLKLSGAYYIRYLDQGLVAHYNNENQRLSYFLSSGITLIYHF